MTVISAQTIRKLSPLYPFFEKTKYNGMTYGLGAASYDVRIGQEIILNSNGFCLASTLEHFKMPNNLVGIVHDKSTWARLGLTVQNTVIDPGFKGGLTLELTNHGNGQIHIVKGTPIAQIIFHLLDQETEIPYNGKYQNQKSEPQSAILELKGEQL